MEPTKEQIEAFREIHAAVGDEAMALVARAMIHSANLAVRNAVSVIHDNLDGLVQAVSADLSEAGETPPVDRVIVETVRAVLATASAIADSNWPTDDADVDYSELVEEIKEAAGSTIVH